LMYLGAGMGACVYLWKLKEVRELTASAHDIEDQIAEGELDEEPPGSGQPVARSLDRD
jgi:glycosyltransferase 2 family protein